MQSIQVATKDVKQIMAAVDPSYRKRQVRIVSAESVEIHDINWCGGTRSEYKACTIDGRVLGSLERFNMMAPWDSRQIEGQSLPLVQGSVVVRFGFFCGKVSTATIYVHPADMPKYLPAST